MFKRGAKAETDNKLQRGVPACLMNHEVKHDYDERGLCKACGASLLEVGGLGSFNLKSCSNRECQNIIAKLASHCPHCEARQKVTPGVHVFRAYTFVCLPIVRYIARPREGGLPFFDLTVLFIGVIVGVFFGKAIRYGGQLRYQKMDIFLAAVVGLSILPVIFKDSIFQSKTPLIVRFGLCIQQGAFSDLLLEGIEKGITESGTP